jgi:outer membrane protein OmpA-like peptidoglycan-associated protein
MTRITVLLVLVLICCSAPRAAIAEDSAAAATGCAVVIGQMAAARRGGDAAGYPAVWDAARDPANACSERAIHCIGDTLALGQLEAAYAAADAGAEPAGLLAVAEAGLAYGAPWQLSAGLGDLYLELARTGGGGAAYDKSSVHYQQALVAIGEPAVCADFGEAPKPAAAETGALYGRLSTALLLAEPLQVVTTRCAPCQWLFLVGVNGFAPDRRPLPITFASGSAEPSAAGREAIAALLECLMARGDTQIVLSGHSDAVGRTGANLRLSQRRLDRVASLLREGGFTGEIVTEARGEEQPFQTEAGGLPEQDQLRLSRRIELVSLEGGQEGSCQ